MTTHPATAAAIAAIGEAGQSDWEVDPAAHRAALADPRAAGPIVRLLARKEPSEIAATYARANKAAVRYQKRFKIFATGAALLAFVAVLLAAAHAIMPANWLAAKIGTDGVTVAAALGIVQAGAAFLALGLSLLVGAWKLDKAWRESRAKAETERLDFCRSIVLAKEPPQAGEGVTTALQLEYMQRFLLEDQLKYFARRGKEHEAVVRRRTFLRWLALLLIVLAGAISLFASPLVDLSEQLASIFAANYAPSALLFFSTVGAGLQSLLTSQALISLDERNAAQYSAMCAALQDLRDKALARTQARAALGGEDARRAVADYFRALETVLGDEHRGWITSRAISEDLQKLMVEGAPAG